MRGRLSRRSAFWASLVFAAVFAVLTTPAHAESPAEFLAAARRTIGTGDALARIHSLHVTMSAVTVGTAGWRASGRTPSFFRTLQIWLSPPNRVLQSLITSARAIGGAADATGMMPGLPPDGSPRVTVTGIDGRRVIEEGADAGADVWWSRHAMLQRLSIVWLRRDPEMLGMTISDGGSVAAGGRLLRVLRAVDGEGYWIRLYFDPLSYRLAMADDNGGDGTERHTYGDYRSVSGVLFPFTEDVTSPSPFPDSPPVLWRYSVGKVEVNPRKLDKVFAK